MTGNRTTELLREGLTERGIEWRSGLKGVTFVGDWCFVEYDNGRLAATCEPVLTPEQAIAATLGSETCELKWTLQGETQTQEFWRCECGNCGYWFGAEDRSTFPFKMTIDKVDVPNYCPNCGAKVIQGVDNAN